MMTDTTEAIEDVAVVDAPPIPGLSFRRAHDDDWPLLTEILNLGRVADGVDEVLSAEGLSSEYRRLDTFETTRDLLIAQIDGDPIGFSLGHRNVRGSVLVLDLWGSVVPEQRRRGIGTALHRTARARLAAEAAADPHPGPRRFQSFALDIERSDIALLEAEGFVPIRSGFEMRRELAGALPHAPFTEGVELRPVTPDHVPAILDADNEAFRDHWGHRETTPTERAARLDDPDTDIGLWQVAWAGDEIAGSVLTTIYGVDNENRAVSRGWLDHVSVRRPWRRRGVARALCVAAFHALRERGMAEAWLGVDGANGTGAVALYEGIGFTVAEHWRAYARPLDGPAPEGWQPED